MKKERCHSALIASVISCWCASSCDKYFCWDGTVSSSFIRIHITKINQVHLGFQIKFVGWHRDKVREMADRLSSLHGLHSPSVHHHNDIENTVYVFNRACLMLARIPSNAGRLLPAHNETFVIREQGWYCDAVTRQLLLISSPSGHKEKEEVRKLTCH